MPDKKLPWIVSTPGLSLNWSWMHKPSVFLDVCQHERGRGSCQCGTGLNDEPHNLCLPCAGLCAARSCPLAPTGLSSPPPPSSHHCSHPLQRERERVDSQDALQPHEGIRGIVHFPTCSAVGEDVGSQRSCVRVPTGQWRGEISQRGERGIDRDRQTERERDRAEGGPPEYYTLKI